MGATLRAGVATRGDMAEGLSCRSRGTREANGSALQSNGQVVANGGFHLLLG
jgi:hypothetical protein